MKNSQIEAAKKRSLWRFLPFLIIIAAFIAVRLSGVGDYLNFSVLAEARADLLALRAELRWLGPLILLLIYALLAAIAMPGMGIVTIAAGFLFGTWIGGTAVLFGATLGATGLFLATGTALRPLLAEKAGPWLTRVNAEVEKGEVSYMLTIRLLPLIPFWIANLAPGFVNVRPFTFIWTSLIGMAPATFIYASIGAGVGSLMDRGEVPQLAGLFLQPNILLPLLGLVTLSLLPVIYRHWKGRRS